MRSAGVVLLLAGLLSGSGAHAQAAAHITASQAWIRVLPGALPAGAYVTLQNSGSQATALTSASSADYARVMLHKSTTTGGMSRMQRVASLPIPAHGKAVLAPAGYHLMLMQANHPVKPGEVVKLTLTFSDGTTLVTDFIARPANALGPGDGAKTTRP